MTITYEPLTIASVQALLSRAGIDCTALVFGRIDRSGFHEAGVHAGRYVEDIGVTITGPKSLRDSAAHVLNEHELWCTPTGDADEWSRGPVAVEAPDVHVSAHP